METLNRDLAAALRWVQGDGARPDVFGRVGVDALSRAAASTPPSVDPHGPRALEYLALALQQGEVGKVSNSGEGWTISGPGRTLHLHVLVEDICTGGGTLLDAYDYVVAEFASHLPAEPALGSPDFRLTHFPTEWPNPVTVFAGQLVTNEQLDDIVRQSLVLLKREKDPDRVLFRSGGVDMTPRRFVETLSRGDKAARVYATVLWRLVGRHNEQTG
jgi:hypothetical protein